LKRAADANQRSSRQAVLSMMKTKVPSFIATAAFCCATALNLTMVEARELAGVSMPQVLSVAGRQLRLNGMGIGTKPFFKVYVIGLYLERPRRTREPQLRSTRLSALFLPCCGTSAAKSLSKRLRKA
jgi:Chalcone isomerase-like